MGADRIISVAIPNQEGTHDYGNMFSVISRCFQVMSARTEQEWKRYSSVVIAPPVAHMSWDSFDSAKRLIDLGEQATLAVMPTIKSWLGPKDAAAGVPEKPGPLAVRTVLEQPK
jgi:predicted acylesterase/phospholipase RssA